MSMTSIRHPLSDSKTGPNWKPVSDTLGNQFNFVIPSKTSQSTNQHLGSEDLPGCVIAIKIDRNDKLRAILKIAAAAALLMSKRPEEQKKTRIQKKVLDGPGALRTDATMRDAARAIRARLVCVVCLLILPTFAGGCPCFGQLAPSSKNTCSLGNPLNRELIWIHEKGKLVLFASCRFRVSVYSCTRTLSIPIFSFHSSRTTPTLVNRLTGHFTTGRSPICIAELPNEQTSQPRPSFQYQ
ncbi:unnamed protein product [Nesidiocoris tenuis]|uniref:Uncharacterized protein n=1 Tax=Nesidiocoris tenuis TaxID=355587 RepID=A0A6H5GBG8_9HEMI|nr:unnamed protein product [Nesidiocoris tenuis]